MTGDSVTPEVLLAVGIAVVVVILSIIFLAWPKVKDADLLDQLRSARLEIRDLLDKINCGKSCLLRMPSVSQYPCQQSKCSSSTNETSLRDLQCTSNQAAACSGYALAVCM